MTEYNSVPVRTKNPLTSEAPSTISSKAGSSRNAPSFQNAVPLFLARFQSPHTRKSYFETLESLGEFLLKRQSSKRESSPVFSPDAIHLADIKEEHLHAFRNHIAMESSLGSRGLEPPTLARKMSTIRSFFRFVRARNWVPEDPSLDIRVPRVPRKSRSKILTPDELGQILDTLQKRRVASESSSRQRRAAELAFAIITTLATTGLRVGELCRLQISDFEPPAAERPGYLLVSRKGGSVQKLPLHPMTSQVLTNYLEDRATLSLCESGTPLFQRAQQTQKITALTPKAVWFMVEKAAKDSGLSVRPSPHTFRASLATEMHRQGILLHHIQDTLGHTNISTTELYIRRLHSMEDSPNLKMQLPKDHAR